MGIINFCTITPMTDRCFRTAAQALFLNYGLIVQGPAGTGKTETAKDFANYLGQHLVVFNCSDQMDYQGIADIIMCGASMNCFMILDEFNRIIPEVLSATASLINTV